MKRVKLSGSAEHPPFLSHSAEEFLAMVAEPKPAPAAGSVAAVTVSMAAALCVKSALLSTLLLPQAPSLADAAKKLMHRSEELCQADADSYTEVMLALRTLRKEGASGDRNEFERAIDRTVQLSAELIDIALEVGSIAAQLAEQGNLNLVGDGVTAALLAEAGVRTSITLAAINLNSLEAQANATELAHVLSIAQTQTARAQEAARKRSVL